MKVKKKPMIKLENVTKIYKSNNFEVKALDNVSLEISKGEAVAVVGASGSGKSTMMNILGGLDSFFEGNYSLNGTNIRDFDRAQLAKIRNRDLGFVFQQYNLISELTVLENVELPLLYRGISKSERRELAKRSLIKVGLEYKENQYPTQLSGGQQQRVSIARALAGNPSVILADEPTGALDSKTGNYILSFMQTLNKEGTTVVIITHDMNVARKMKRIIQIMDGKIISDTGTDAYEH